MARSAMPRYTAAISDSGQMAIATRKGSLPSPAGTTRPMRASGTKTDVEVPGVDPLRYQTPPAQTAGASIGLMPPVAQTLITFAPYLRSSRTRLRTSSGVSAL